MITYRRGYRTIVKSSRYTGVTDLPTLRDRNRVYLEALALTRHYSKSLIIRCHDKKKEKKFYIKLHIELC